MLTMPDVRASQLIVVQTEFGVSNYLQLRNDNLLFRKDGKVTAQCSLHRAFCVIVVGDMAISTGLIRKLNQHGVCVLLLKRNLEPYSLFGARSEGNYLLRQQQYFMTRTQAHDISRQIMLDKTNNQGVLLRSAQQDEVPLLDIREKMLTVSTREEMLGLEGTASKYFFARYFDGYDWHGRMPRAKTDVANFLLDIGYTIAFNFVDTFLRLFGFDSYKGVYHQLFYARKSLACDAVEPFRCLIERRLRVALNRGEIRMADFKHTRYGVRCNPPEAQKYAAMFAEVMLERREDIYTYTHGLYRHMMDSKNPRPTYQLRR